jgi:hypothetical protein
MTSGDTDERCLCKAEKGARRHLRGRNNGRILYTNSNVCGSLPTEEEVIKKAEEFSRTRVPLGDDQLPNFGGT